MHLLLLLLQGGFWIVPEGLCRIFGWLRYLRLKLPQPLLKGLSLSGLVCGLCHNRAASPPRFCLGGFSVGAPVGPLKNAPLPLPLFSPRGFLLAGGEKAGKGKARFCQ